jgi:hypothetical protein
MAHRGPVLAILALAGAGVVLGACGGGEPGPTTQTTAAPVTARRPPTTAKASGSLVVIGDSLAAGIEPLLPAALPGWTVAADGRGGRRLAEGMQILAATDLPRGAVLAISLFTNDDPTDTAALDTAVGTALHRVGAQGCVLWATIVRPAVDGVTYAAANAVLHRRAAADGRLVVVPWAEAIAARPSLLGGDGVHPTPAGYRLRAQLYARAATSCARPP